MGGKRRWRSVGGGVGPNRGTGAFLAGKKKPAGTAGFDKFGGVLTKLLYGDELPINPIRYASVIINYYQHTFSGVI
ncbi:hypothetical protein D3C76_1709260 [compost metagenome]